jgi:F-type H+-transporting ATPase subunit b
MQESLDALGLDWRQLVTNFLGFAVFLWLMARYAWKPMLSFMDKRRDEIAGHYRRIESEQGELGKLKKEYEGKLARIEEEATHRIQEAIRQGQEAAHQIEDQARTRAVAIVEKAKADTERVVEQAKLDLKNFVVDIGVEAGRKAAMGVLDERSHRELVERYVQELSNVR